MYNHDGQNIFVVDGHMHFWDANPENWRNKYGESWIKCFHAFHSGLSPAEEVWPFDKFCHYGEEVLVNDLFRTGYVDMAVLNSTYLYEFYKNGFNTHLQNNVIKAKHPDRFLLCGSFDPRDEEAGFDAFRRMMAEYPINGLKLSTRPSGATARAAGASTTRGRTGIWSSARSSGSRTSTCTRDRPFTR